MTDRLVLANAKAGASADEAVEIVREILRQDGAVEIARPSALRDLDATLAGRDDRELVILGGDGSLHLAVSRLHHRGELADAVLALVPLGTGNDFARSVGLPLDPADAARVALEGEPRSMDLLVDDAGGVVVNAVHLGVGALAGDQATGLKPHLGKAAYAVGAIKAGIRTPGWRVGVVADGVELVDARSKILLVGVGNGSSVGGGTPLTPYARVDDGRVDVVISRSVGPIARVGFAIGLRLGRHVERDDVTTARARHVRLHGGPIPINTDGEIGDPVARREWSVQPSAWRLRVPR